MVTTAFIVLLVCMGTHRFLVSRGIGSLSAEQKVKLVDYSAARRQWLFIALLAGILILTLMTANLGHRELWLAGFLGLVAILGITLTLARLVGLSRLGLSKSYMRSVWTGGLLLMFALVLLFGAMAYKIVTFVPE